MNERTFSASLCPICCSSHPLLTLTVVVRAPSTQKRADPQADTCRWAGQPSRGPDRMAQCTIIFAVRSGMPHRKSRAVQRWIGWGASSQYGFLPRLRAQRVAASKVWSCLSAAPRRTRARHAASFALNFPDQPCGHHPQTDKSQATCRSPWPRTFQSLPALPVRWRREVCAAPYLLSRQMISLC